MDEGLFRRRRLPHWDAADATYFVTACLAGSVPARGLIELNTYRQQLDARACPANLNAAEWEVRKHKLVFARFDELIDDAPAVDFLATPAVADCVRDAIYHFAGIRYELLAYVVMPSHFHWLFHPLAAGETTQEIGVTRRTAREKIMHSIKSYTANQCNRLLARGGPFWQDESYDHVVRNDDELLRIIQYVENNPIKAGLVSRPEDWRWSSAADRQRQLKVPGVPLRKG
jgi:type I restriction enzyme R subunit